MFLNVSFLLSWLENKRNYDVSVFYATESDKEEEYEKLAKEAINEKRKAGKFRLHIV